MKKFDTLLKSEIKKAEAAANKHLNRSDCKVTAYSSKPSKTTPGFYDVECEICFDYEEVAEISVMVAVFMPDRRRSFATVKTW